MRAGDDQKIYATAAAPTAHSVALDERERFRAPLFSSEWTEVASVSHGTAALFSSVAS